MDDDVESYIDSRVEKKLQEFKRMSEVSASSSGEIVPPQVKQFTEAIKMVKELGDVARGDLDKIVSDGVKQKMAESIVPVLFNQSQKSSWWDTGFAQQLAKGLGDKIGENATGIIDNLTKNFGSEDTKKMINTVIGGGAREGAGTGGGAVAGSGQTEENVIDSLDPDNPNHLHYYMSMRRIGTENVDNAKKSLLAEKENIRIKRGGGGVVPGGGNIGTGVGGIGSGVNADVSGLANKADQISIALEGALKEQNAYLEKMILRQNQSDEVIKFLIDKVDKLEKGGRTERGEKTDVAEKTEVNEEDKLIADSIRENWDKDIEKNKKEIKEREEREEREKREREERESRELIEKIEREKEEREKYEKELRELKEKEEKEKVAVIGKIRKTKPVYEPVYENENNISNISSDNSDNIGDKVVAV